MPDYHVAKVVVQLQNAGAGEQAMGPEPGKRGAGPATRYIYDAADGQTTQSVETSRMGNVIATQFAGSRCSGLVWEGLDGADPAWGQAGTGYDPTGPGILQDALSARAPSTPRARPFLSGGEEAISTGNSSQF